MGSLRWSLFFASGVLADFVLVFVVPWCLFTRGGWHASRCYKFLAHMDAYSHSRSARVRPGLRRNISCTAVGGIGTCAKSSSTYERGDVVLVGRDRHESSESAVHQSVLEVAFISELVYAEFQRPPRTASKTIVVAGSVFTAILTKSKTVGKDKSIGARPLVVDSSGFLAHTTLTGCHTCSSSLS